MGYRIAGAIGTLMVAGTVWVQAPVRAAESLIDAASFPGEFSANVAVVSEYFFRGMSQTDDAPALQGGLDYEVDLTSEISAYLGVWGSNVRFNEGSGVSRATVEIDIYGGFSGNIGTTGFNWDVGFIYYTYPGASSSLNYDFVEAQGALGYDFGPAALTGSINWSPDYFGGSGTATYYKLQLDVPVMNKVDLSAHIGRQNIAKNAVFGAPNYWDWGVSATVNVLGFDLSVAYTGTDIPGSPDGAADMVHFGISRSF